MSFSFVALGPEVCQFLLGRRSQGLAVIIEGETGNRKVNLVIPGRFRAFNGPMEPYKDYPPRKNHRLKILRNRWIRGIWDIYIYMIVCEPRSIRNGS